MLSILGRNLIANNFSMLNAQGEHGLSICHIDSYEQTQANGISVECMYNTYRKMGKMGNIDTLIQ